MITLYEPNTKILRLNREFERVIGWTTQEAERISLMEQCYPDSDYREQIRQYMESCREGWLDIRMRTRDGRTIETDNVADYERARREWEARGLVHHGMIYALDPPFNRHRSGAIADTMVRALAHLLSSATGVRKPFRGVHWLRPAS
jgi:PAS domain-containing protein